MQQVCRQDLGPHREFTLEHFFHPVEDTHTGIVYEEFQPTGRTHIRGIHTRLSSLGGTPPWNRGKVVLSFRKKQQRQHVVS